MTSSEAQKITLAQRKIELKRQALQARFQADEEADLKYAEYKAEFAALTDELIALPPISKEHHWSPFPPTGPRAEVVDVGEGLLDQYHVFIDGLAMEHFRRRADAEARAEQVNAYFEAMGSSDDWNDWLDDKAAYTRHRMEDSVVEALAQNAARDWPAYNASFGVQNVSLSGLVDTLYETHCLEIAVPIYHFADGTTGRIEFAAAKLLGYQV